MEKLYRLQYLKYKLKGLDYKITLIDRTPEESVISSLVLVRGRKGDETAEPKDRLSVVR
jgi:hypothetical protein